MDNANVPSKGQKGCRVFWHLSRCSLGQAAVEFAVIIPLVLLIVSVVIELTTVFVTAEKVSNVSREISKAVYYDCAGREGDQDSAGSSIRICVNETFNKVNLWASKVLPGLDANGGMIVTIYESPDGNSVSRKSWSFFPAAATVRASRYLDVTSGSLFDLIKSAKIVVIGEVFYPFTAKTPLGGTAVVRGLFPSDYYESATF